MFHSYLFIQLFIHQTLTVYQVPGSAGGCYEWTFINVSCLVNDKVTSVTLNPKMSMLQMTLQLLKASFPRWGN